MGTHPIFESDFDCLTDVRNIMGDEKSGSDVEVDNDSVFSDTKAEMTNQKSATVGPMVVPVQVDPNWSNIDSSKTLPLGGAQVPLTSSLVQRSIIVPSPHSPHSGFIIAARPHTIPNLTNSVTEPQIFNPNYGRVSSNLFHLPLSSASPQINSRLEEARNKDQLAVYCNSAKFQAILDKSRFGSGSKGMCIHYLNEWMTPRMFEVKCGLEKSRDWRRTIHYQGDTLKTLIQYNILKPHAQSCACKICSNNMTDAAPKFEDEVKSRRSIRNKDGFDGGFQRPAKKRKDIFFPESSTSTPIVIHNIGGASPIVSGGEELLAHPLMNRVPNEDRTKLKTLLDRFAITQSNSQSRISKCIERMEALENELNELKETIQLEKHSEQQRESDMIQFLSTLTNCMTSSSVTGHVTSPVLPTGSVITNGLSGATIGPTSVIRPNGYVWTPRTIIDPSSKLHTAPNSAPPESPVRVHISHDRRRTSSDNVVPKSSSVQKCSNTGCEQTAAYMCQGCNKAIYCGRNCQEEAWNNGHDSVCGEDDLESEPGITKEIST